MIYVMNTIDTNIIKSHHIIHLRSWMTKLLDDVHKCYYCCLARMASFQTAVAKPSKVRVCGQSIMLISLTFCSQNCVLCCQFSNDNKMMSIIWFMFVQDLTLGLVSRCKGYAYNLMSLVCEQRIILAETAQSSKDLK